MRSIIVIAHNIRSAHNIGSIFRTCEGFGVEQIILSGYSPYPILPDDERLPHISQKITKDIHKTALGAEDLVPFTYTMALDLSVLRNRGYRIVALEQATHSISLPQFDAPDHIALILGEEVNGITTTLLSQCDDIVEIPMYGRKESFNVSVAAGIALYQLLAM